MSKTHLVPVLALGLLSAFPQLGGVTQAQQQPAPPADAQTPTFRATVNLVSSDVIVRNRRGQFQADLTKDDFEVLEDGVPQEVSSFVLVHGGRVFTTQTAAAPIVQAREGVILPAARPVNDAAGRIILFVIDDLHLLFRDTHRIRGLFRNMAKELVHDGDLFGVVSTGTSSIAIDLTYDRSRMEEAANRISGGGMKPSEIIENSTRGQTPQELLYRANVAFQTMARMLSNLEKAQNRRKAVVLISTGYDFDPFAGSRATGNILSAATGVEFTNDPIQGRGGQWNDAELSMRLGELTRMANRANATFYTFDPRGLVAGQDIDEPVDQFEWDQHLRKQQDSMRVIAEQTGGIAVVNTNDFSKALRRIDAETSDYYVLAYYSSNPDPTRRRRQIEIRSKKKDPEGGELEVMYRREYTLKPLPAAVNP